MIPAPEIKLLQEQLRAKEDMLDRTTTYLLNARKELEQLNAKLTLTNDELTSSIRFAMRIQQPLIPSAELLNSFFSDSGIYIHQKFHIGGDFVYGSRLKDFFVFGLFDCTGHGVPGALLAIYGHSLLGEIISKLDMKDPAAILDLMAERLFKSFSENSASSSVETMDGILCRFDYKSNVLTYASARRAAFILKNDKVEDIVSTKRSIGENLNKFVDQQASLSSGDKIILFSDGLTDQYESADKQKFGKKRLAALLEENHHENAKGLARVIEAALRNWQGSNEQTDDISFLIIEI